MGEFSLSDVKVRPLEKEDLEAIVQIDYKVLGNKRPDYWRQKIEEGTKGPVKSLVAEYEDKVVGFILGTVSGWEFGVPSSFGWIDTIGVDPDFQRKGIGRLLFESLVKEFSRQGIKKIYTLVNWNDWTLISFFKAVGFSRGELINLEYDVKT